LLNKYLKCSVWRLALRYDIYIYMSLGFKRLMTSPTLRASQLDASLNITLKYDCQMLLGLFQRPESYFVDLPQNERSMSDEALQFPQNVAKQQNLPQLQLDPFRMFSLRPPFLCLLASPFACHLSVLFNLLPWAHHLPSLL